MKEKRTAAIRNYVTKATRRRRRILLARFFLVYYLPDRKLFIIKIIIEKQILL